MKRKALGKGLTALLPDPEPQRTGGPLRRGADRAPGAQSLPAPHGHGRRCACQSWRTRSARAGSSSRSWCGVSAIATRSSPASVAGARRRPGPRHACRSRCARCRTSGCWSWRSSRTSSAQELTPLEEAQAFQRLQDEFRLTQEEVARKVGRDRSTVANTLRLLRLPPPVRELLAGGRLDAGHGRALLALESAEEQVALAREAARKSLSVREVERRVASLRAPGGVQARRTPTPARPRSGCAARATAPRASRIASAARPR